MVLLETDAQSEGLEDSSGDGVEGPVEGGHEGAVAGEGGLGEPDVGLVGVGF